MLKDVGADSVVECKGTVWDSNENVLRNLIVAHGVFDLVSGGDESQTEVALDIS